MSAIRLRKFGSLDLAEIFLRGAILSGPLAEEGPANTIVYGLDTKTLIFTTPSHTVTFADSSMAGLHIGDIAGQIQTVLGGSYQVRILQRHLVITEVAPTTGITLSHTGTANAKLGFDSNNDSVGTVFAAPDGTAPRLIEVSTFGVSENLIMLTTEE
jgi:hypothetical protein